MVSKFKIWFRNTSDKIKTSVRVKQDAPFFMLALILIVILSIIIRLSPVINGTFLIKAFDPWVQFDGTKYIIENGWYEWFNFHDSKMWFPEGINRYELRPGLLFTCAIFYWILSGLGIPVTPFEVAFYFPAFMGGLTVLVMYFLGKEILDKRTGLLAALFLAVSPGHMQRTVAGFYDNETIGVLSLLLVLLFYIKATKSGRLLHGIIGGCALGYLALSWGGLTYPFLLIPLLSLILILANKYDSKILLAYATTIGVGALIFIIAPSFKWSVMLTEMDFMLPVLFFVFLIAYQLLYMQKESGLYDKVLTVIKWAAIPIAITAAIIFWQKPEWIPLSLAGRLESILNPNIRETFHLVASVGEHMPSPWSVFYYNTLVALLFVIPGIYFAIRRGEAQDLLIIIFTLTLFYFTGSMIRIILLFAPAIALIGAYGLSNILKNFGNLMQKEQVITRRRKRQLKRTMGRPEGLVVYAIIGVLLFVQVNHAVTISSEQLGYSELVAGGVYHDWEESLTWMKYNLPGTAVVVSWWDYGYWITTIGNVTSVNDNGTLNNTRIGLTGMAMMQTNERYSAEIFQALQADYVLVYFGHLIPGLGGDEGKWPWMVRICNDHTDYYKNLGLEKDNWYGDENNRVDTVFNEDEYINSTSGAYESKWFDSTIVKLMLYGEPTSLASASTNTQAYYAAEIEGSEQYGVTQRTDDDGNPWANSIPENGEYNLQFFQPEYFSANSLVKIFKVDYTALEASMEIVETSLDTDGYGYAKIENTGSTNFTIGDLSINGAPFNSTVEYPTQEVAPGESRYIWVDTNEEGNIWESNDIYDMTVSAQVVKDSGATYTFSNSSVDTQVIEPIAEEIRISREESRMQLDDGDLVAGAYINVINTGERPAHITDFTINNDVISSDDIYNDENNNFLIAPGESETFFIAKTFAPPNDLSWDGNVTVSTAEGESDATSLAYNRLNHKLTIVSGDLEILPEQEYLYDYNAYTNKEAPIERFYTDYNDDSYLLENGTLILTVRNDGDSVFGFQNVFVDGESIDYTVLDEGDNAYFPNSTESRTIKAFVPNVERNVPVKVFVTSEYTGTVASDALYMVPRNSSNQIAIATGEDSMTSLFTNESLRLVIKNVGFGDLSLDTITLNGTETIALQSENIIFGNSILGSNEVAVVQVDFSDFKVNLTDTLDIQVNTNETFAFATTTLEAKLPGIELVGLVNEGVLPIPGLLDTRARAADVSDQIRLLLAVYQNETVNLDGVYLMQEEGEYQFVDLSLITLVDSDGASNGYIINGSSEDDYTYYYITFRTSDIGVSLSVDDTIWVKIVTTEGFEDFVELTVVA